ncbi:MAG: alpha/beta hydrolase, partial [Clostridia bacterium]|nr:alpha/beta hydrolase [Clostridia bacterium]
MQYCVYKLGDIFPQLKTGVFEPILTSYCPDNTPEVDPDRKFPSIVICPGGGYEFTSDREAEPVALNFAASGYNTFVLRYSLAPARYPQALLELSAAMAFVRRHAEEFHVDPEQIAVCGFSAGGHLACSLGTLWQEPFIAETLKLAAGENRPNAMILCYPVISSGIFAHRGSFDNLLGTDAPAGLLEKTSLEKQVGPGTPPAFIWHTFDDDVVPVQNALLLAQALRDHNVPFELHIFPHGAHGLSLCDSRTDTDTADFLPSPKCSVWTTLCKAWL